MERDEIDIPGAMRPRTGRGPKADPHRVPRFRSALLSRIARGSGRKGGSTAGGFGGPLSGSSAREPSTNPFAGRRRCIVKVRYVPMTSSGREGARLHLKYLERDGVERDGSRGRLYGPGAEFDAAAFAAPTPAERNQFRFIVSPEDANDLDLTGFARGLMRQVEADLGRPLSWGAVNHFNTDQPHVHIVVRGIDGHGNQVRIPPRYISFGMRETAERLLTRHLGLRSELDEARRRVRDVESERFTALDRALASLAAADGTLPARAMRATARGQRSTFVSRLQVLRRLGLAERLGSGWRLEQGWERSLQELGKRGDMVKRLAGAVRGELGSVRLLDHAPDSAFDGVIRGKGLHDELAGTLFVAVGAPSGETFYVPVAAEIAEAFEAGDIVRVDSDSETWVKPNDRVVAKFAELNGGFYDPAAHEQNLVELRRGKAEGAVPAAVLVAANIRRLERLAKFGLVERLPGGRWSVPRDLVERLEERERARPRRLTVRRAAPPLADQVKHEGPTWLDTGANRAAGAAGHGFGAELARARRARAEFVRGLGIDPDGPDAKAVLESLEPRALARRLGRSTGHRFVPASPGFNGQVASAERLPSGSTYLVIVDAADRRFTLMPAQSGATVAVGERVALRLGSDGRLELRRSPDRTRGQAE